MEGQTSRKGRPSKLSSEAAGNATALVGLELLKVIARAHRPMQLTEIASLSRMSASRTHRYLSSLQHAGFVQQDGETGRYELGPSTVEIGIAATRHISGDRHMAEVMRELTNATGLCSYVCIWSTNGPVVIRDEMGDVQTAVRMRLGTHLSLLTATGQIFLSHLPLEVTQDLLGRDIAEWNAEVPGTSVTLEDIMRERAKVRSAGIARTQGMKNPTWTAFSCPVLDLSGRLRLALTIIGVSAFFDTSLDGPAAIQLKRSALKLAGAASAVAG